MVSMKFPLHRFLSILVITSCLVTGLSAGVRSQSLPGLVIFSGIDRANQLGYVLEFGGRTSEIDRYRLRIPANKLGLATNQFAVTYPASYQGSFDPKAVEVRAGDESVPLDEVNWDQENRVINIYPVTPVPAHSRVEIVLSDVRNPSNGGTHYFNAMVRSPGDLPTLSYVGTWIIGIGDGD
jgi:hypothetical protein